MKGIIHKIFRKKESIYFRKADLEESTKKLCNPARGWYQLYTFVVEEEPDFVNLATCLDEQESLVLVLIDIGAFRSRDLSEAAIAQMIRILNFFIEAGKDVILRVTYDHQGKALEREPSLFTQVMKHLEQIGELVAEFGESIFVYQGMLIGNWGEMHGSKFLDADHLERMAEVLEQYNQNTFLAVRRPVQWRSLHHKRQDEAILAKGMGLYDDAVLGSFSDLGTFGEMPSEKAGWSNAWLREEELHFIDKLCTQVPNGGETVLGDGFWKALSQEQLLTDLGKMHITYLNCLYDRQILDEWKESIYLGKDVWSGQSLYDYIGAHLGYRLLIKDVKLSLLKRYDKQVDYEIEVAIENVGFANLYQEVVVSLEWTNSKGIVQRQALAADLRECNRGMIKYIRYFIDIIAGRIYLSVNRKSDGRRIYLANQADEDGKVCLGEICER